MGPHPVLGKVKVLQEQLVDLWWQRLLQDAQQGVGLSTHCYSQGEVLNTVFHITLCQELLTQLNL